MHGFHWNRQPERRIAREREAAGQADRGLDAVRTLEGEHARLALVCHALWTLLRERTGLTEEDLLARVRELDLRDGREDGRIATTVSSCRSCGRVLARRHARCIYCGSARLRASAFDAV